MEPDLGHPIPDHPLPPLIKSYYNKQERDWWHQANLPEKLDYDYSEMESTFMERKTPGGVKNTSAPGQYPPPSVRSTPLQYSSEENSGPPVFPNTFPISRGYSSYVWHSYLSPLTMVKAWFSRERIPRTNIRVSYMHAEKLDYDYSEMESTFLERKTPGGVKNTSAPGQYPPPSTCPHS
jgi:hypothetical protein